MLLACDFQPVHGDNLPDPRGTPLLNAPRTGEAVVQSSKKRAVTDTLMQRQGRVLIQHYHPMLH